MFAFALIFLVSAQTLHTTLAAVAKHPIEDLPIQYPEPIQQAKHEKGDVPDKCKDLTYCTIKPKNYPEEKFNELLKGYKDPRRIRRTANEEDMKPHATTSSEFQPNEAPVTKPSLPQPSMVMELTFNNRQGDPDDSDNCESEVTYEPLYQVREKRDQPWRTVVQAPGQDFVQRIRIERCINPGAKCFTVFAAVPEYVTFCKQKVNTWEVLVAKENNETETIKAELPVCCSCHYRPVDFVTRFGKPKE